MVWNYETQRRNAADWPSRGVLSRLHQVRCPP
jgi:hypothetical protein